MNRIVLLVFGFIGGAALGASLAFGAFEVLNPPPAAEKQEAGQGEAKKPDLLTERNSRLWDWLTAGSVVGGLGGLAAMFYLVKPDDDSPRPPVDFKIGDEPPVRPVRR